jgi:hypothetical protein
MVNNNGGLPRLTFSCVGLLLEVGSPPMDIVDFSTLPYIGGILYLSGCKGGLFIGAYTRKGVC